MKGGHVPCESGPLHKEHGAVAHLDLITTMMMRRDRGPCSHSPFFSHPMRSIRLRSLVCVGAWVFVLVVRTIDAQGWKGRQT